jgi:RHS repeat-associated protein
MTDTSGDQIETTMKYLPFGGTRSGAVPTDKKFTGQRLDETGLYYYGARYYDAGMGRFISPDTIIPHPANPQSFNRYSYCLNNPLKYIDPSGHIVEIYGLDIRSINDWDWYDWVWFMSNTTEEVIHTIIAYDEFRNYTPETYLAAKTMENDTEHVISIHAEKSDTIWWARTEHNGNHYEMTLNSKMFTNDPRIPPYKRNVILDQVRFKILDMTADFNWGMAFLKGVLDFFYIGILLDIPNPYYQYKIGEQGLGKTLIDYGAMVTRLGGWYSFIESLITQQSLFDEDAAYKGYYEYRN